MSKNNFIAGAETQYILQEGHKTNDLNKHRNMYVINIISKI